MKRFAAALLFIGLAVVSLAQVDLPSKYRKEPPKAGDTVAKVGGQPILASDVEPWLWEWLGKGATNDLISYLMVKEDAAKKGIVVSDAEVEKAVDQEIAALRNSRPANVDDDVNKWLEEQGFTRSRMFLRMKSKLLMDKVLENTFHPENYVKVSTILVKPASADAAAVSAAIGKVQAAYDRLQKGEAWEKVLADSTTEKNAVRSKGELGWRELTAFPGSVQKELPSLAAGGYTKPAQTNYGIQLFRVDARGAELKGEELQGLKEYYMSAMRKQYLQDLQKTVKVERLLK
ncbi:MAG: hypothetical protein QOJ65_2448 [Fimbriimonadaceae bacterium]|jgi:parvulin-like peptidyl-prolyl isomerase|nr:hypothetical protein [Fimbriimonadaceae bacterium]